MEKNCHDIKWNSSNYTHFIKQAKGQTMAKKNVYLFLMVFILRICLPQYNVTAQLPHDIIFFQNRGGEKLIDGNDYNGTDMKG